MRMISTHPLSLLLALILLPLISFAGTNSLNDFQRDFRDETLRIDYYHTGNSKEEIISLDQLWRQGTWAGSRTHLVDDLDLGRYYAKVYDAKNGQLLFSHGFDSYYGEWKTTGPAAEGVRRTYHESVLIPFPLRPVEFVLEVRHKDMSMTEIYRVAIDPGSYMIREDPLDNDVLVIKQFAGGDPHGCVDVAILGEGYTKAEEEKFRADVKRFAGVMMGQEPYKSSAKKFNIWGVLKPSQESGCDEPSRGLYRNTALGCTFTSDNQWSPYVFLHEFGQSFAGLADEYYSSSTSYNDFYPAGREPNERNITALLDKKNLKWGDLTTSGVDVPTAWDKAEYDAMDIEYQKRRAANNQKIVGLMKNGGSEQDIEAAKAEGEALSKDHQAMVDAWFKTVDSFGQVGAFEGAGYMSEGMFRSEIDCIMFTKGIKPFCAACVRGIGEITERYTE